MLKPLAGALGSHAAEHHCNNGEDRRDRTNNFRAEERVLPPSIGPTILRCIIVPEPPLTSAGGPYYRMFLCQRGDLAHFDSANPRAHEALHELALEQQEADQQRRRGHQRRGADDRPVDALVARGEHLQADGQRARLDRVGDDQRPQEIVPVIADRDEPVGEVDRASPAARRPSAAPAAARRLRRARRRRAPSARS